MLKNNLSQKEFLVLGIVTKYSEICGIDVVEKSLGFVKLSTVYVVLRELEYRNFVTSRLEEDVYPKTKIPKRYYNATQSGKAIWQVEYIKFKDLSNFVENLK